MSPGLIHDPMSSYNNTAVGECEKKLILFNYNCE